MPVLAINEKCYGCAACSNICPKNCIEMKLNINGEWRPFISTTNCIECQKCVKVCPALKKPILREPLKTYAMTITDKKKKNGCASGGMARVLYEYALSNGSVVYGCDFKQGFVLRMRSADKIDFIEDFRNSKYTFCRMEHTYKEIKNNLEKKIPVLFIGSSCQVDALKCYLGGEKDGLLTVDLVCHGVPPEQYFKDYIQMQNQKYKECITSVKLRGENKNKDFYMRLYSGEKCLYDVFAREDLFYAGYVNCAIYEEKCYSCPYAVKRRVADITIGDWGVSTSIANQKLSLVLANSPKAVKELEKIFNRQDVLYEEHTLQEAVDCNEQLRSPSKKPEFYDEMRECYRSHNFEIMAKRYIMPLVKQYKRRKKNEEIKKIVYIPMRVLGKIKRMVNRT